MRPTPPWRAAAAALALSASGCPVNNGTDPPTDRLFFPTAAALHRASPTGPADYLYVVNANFDLQYNGSTVTALRLDTVRQRLRDHAGCREDSATRGLFHCDDAGFLEARFTRKTNPYAVDAALGVYGATGATQRLYVLVRGGNSMTWFDVGADGGLDCGAADENGYCAADHSAGADPAQSPANVRLPADPSSLSIDPDRGWVVVTHQSTDVNAARASLFRDPVATTPGQRVAPQLLNVVGGIAQGLSGLALVPRAPGDAASRSTWIATSRSEAVFTTLQVYPGSTALGDNRAFLYRASATAVSGLNNGADTRSIAIDPLSNRTRAYAVSRRPEALLTLDVSNPTAPSVLDAIPLSTGASRIAVVPDRALGRSRVYVANYESRWIYVVDPAEHAVVATIPSGRGPHALVHDPVDQKLYVLDFLDAAVSVIDVAPTTADGATNPSYNRRVLTIGRPGRPGVTS